MSGTEVQQELRALADPKRASACAWFFKTGPGEYGAGDKFLGITVPAQRAVAKKYWQKTSLADIARLLKSPYHECRFTGLEALVFKYEKGSEKDRSAIYHFYLAHTNGINNWDLVDTSAPYIVGDYLKDRPRTILKKLARSKNVWERRIAIVSTFAFIRRGELDDTFMLADMLLGDTHDLIRKAVGWALREAGKVSDAALESFLKAKANRMSRVTLRYAIEKFSPQRRKAYLSGSE